MESCSSCELVKWGELQCCLAQAPYSHTSLPITLAHSLTHIKTLKLIKSRTEKVLQTNSNIRPELYLKGREYHHKSDGTPAPPRQWCTRPMYIKADHLWGDDGDYSASTAFKPFWQPDGVKAVGILAVSPHTQFRWTVKQPIFTARHRQGNPGSYGQ